ncbi:MAG: cobalt ECF transporter T component CbiQ [Pseudomonadota bacterium]
MIKELANGNSFIQDLDPRIKIVVVFLFSVVVAAADRFQVLLWALTLGILIVGAARVPVNEICRRLIPVNLLIVFLWLLLPFTFTGKPLFYLGPLAATREGVLYATRISIKSNAMMLMLITLAASTPIFILGHAMHALRVPPKLVHLFFFTFRYIHVMYREYFRLVNSMKIRGFTPGNNLHTYRTIAYMVGMLLVRSFDRAQRVHNAMLCRGFKGDLYSLRKFSLNGRDVAALILMVTVILILGILECKRTI